jgi:hypothetical protein
MASPGPGRGRGRAHLFRLLPLFSPLLLLGCDRPYDYQPPRGHGATSQTTGSTASKAVRGRGAAGAVAALGSSCYPADLEKRLAALGPLPDSGAPPAAAIAAPDGLSFHKGRPDRPDRGDSEPAGAGALSPLPAGQAGVEEAVRRVRSVIKVQARVYATRQVENAAATAGRVMYNPSFFSHIRRNGGDSAVVGILAHEFGHIAKGHVYRQPRSIRQSQRGELEADAEAGCALAKLKMDPRGYVRVTHALGGGGSFTHPDGERRAEAIQGGFARCRGQSAPLVAQAPRGRGRGGPEIEQDPGDGDGDESGEGGFPGGGVIVRRGPMGGSFEIEIPDLADLGDLRLPGLGQDQADDDGGQAVEPAPRRRRGQGRAGRHGRPRIERGDDDGGAVARAPRRRHRPRPPVERDDDGSQDGASGGGGFGGLPSLNDLGDLAGLDGLTIDGLEIELPEARHYPRLSRLAERLGHMFDFLDFEPPWGYLPRQPRRTR